MRIPMHAKKNIHRLFLALLTLVPLLLHGQYYNLGQDPSALKWRQINTPGFRIIYPENFEQKAQKMIPMLNNIVKQGGKTLAFKPGKVPFILHNYNTEANAVTVWTPKRVELYTCPPQDNYAQDWLDQLVTHEYRHVVQLDRTNQGFTRVLSWLTGEQAAALVSGLFVPPWFMEGDAVCTETALSRSGRGRIPSFEMLLRAQVTQRGSPPSSAAFFMTDTAAGPKLASAIAAGHQISWSESLIASAKNGMASLAVGSVDPSEIATLMRTILSGS